MTGEELPVNSMKLDELNEASKLAGQALRWASLFERHEVLVGLFAPRGADTQGPHDRDEIYIVSSGSGLFRRHGETVEVKAGDFLFVPAGVEHRFEDFSPDLRTWVILFGPKLPDGR
jgi:mannose-6-phosphate isomerase-like protein (cupin superfamily)